MSGRGMGHGLLRTGTGADFLLSLCVCLLQHNMLPVYNTAPGWVFQPKLLCVTCWLACM
jgi:hypothetical protein